MEPSLLLRLHSSIRGEKRSLTNASAGRACPNPIPGAKVLKLVTGLTYLCQRNRPAAVIFPQRHPFSFFKPCVNVNNQSLETANCLGGHHSKGEDKDRLGSSSGCRAAESCWARAAGLELSSIKKNPKDINMVYCNNLEPAELPNRNKSVETPGEFGSITTQPHASAFLAKLCAVPRGTRCSWCC